jgi:hypothetical protein
MHVMELPCHAHPAGDAHNVTCMRHMRPNRSELLIGDSQDGQAAHWSVNRSILPPLRSTLRSWLYLHLKPLVHLPCR